MSAAAADSTKEKPSGLIPSLYRRLQHWTAALESPFLLLVRVYWGWQFAATGWGKLHHLAHVTQFFTSLGLPLPGFTAVFVSGLEFVGGILLIAGFGTRLLGLLLAVDMLV
ncbi:MAG: DoxX family protein, partial [Acidobacteriaceae bacterium]